MLFIKDFVNLKKVIHFYFKYELINETRNRFLNLEVHFKNLYLINFYNKLLGIKFVNMSGLGNYKYKLEISKCSYDKIMIRNFC